ncbi:hypothetical protein FNV43_RR07323 [Rhamnella rubrinervis]|uniref:Uncharacterized protein n=1 Tax=Rhamnella rubrinervis TaxID=2594499 RepID=A0A8K0HGD6_9ROSA|nr:hypothetical protein FNV43_RR07323 [Rhamnella rubrinervis]
MPLPWKKTGVNRISQIVADIHSKARWLSCYQEFESRQRGKGASHGDGGVERSSGSGLMAKIENQNRSFVVLDDEEEEEEECVGRDSSAVIMAALKVLWLWFWL